MYRIHAGAGAIDCWFSECFSMVIKLFLTVSDFQQSEGTDKSLA